MKYGDKIYTYKDIEEAKKLIGKKIVASSSFYDISERPNLCPMFILTACNPDDYNNPFFVAFGNCRQFIREVIEKSGVVE